jgi:uncharacterized OB-fold protein
MNELPVVAYKCKKCGKIHYPFHDRCLKCKEREFEQIPFGGEAKLIAYTQIFNLPWGFDQRFLVIGVAEFKNGVKAMGQIDVDSLQNLKSGTKLKAKWAPVRVTAGVDVYGIKYELA